MNSRTWRALGWSALLVASAAATAAAGHEKAPDAGIRPFTIRIPDAALADLKTRLGMARIAEPLQGAGWTFGTDTAYLSDLVSYWRTRFDWRTQEKRLNQFEQFTTDIDGLAFTSSTGDPGVPTRCRC